MPQFLRNFFGRPARSKPFEVPKKKVKDVLGESFDYFGQIRINGPFCQRILKYNAREGSPENVLFVLMCEKYATPHTHLTFDDIYKDFIEKGCRFEINIATGEYNELKFRYDSDEPDATRIHFDEALITIKALLKNDTLFRLSNQIYDEAFLFEKSYQKSVFDDAIAYLEQHRINLL